MSRSNQIAGLITATPTATLDTINEINTSLNNDANLSTTLTNNITTKMPLAGGLFTGNVGIGASSLTGGNVGLDVHKTGSGVGSQIRLKNQHNAGFYIGQAGDTTGEVIIWNDANTDMQFRTNGDERLRIRANGNVDIGGASHAARKFSIKGSANDNSENTIEVLNSDSTTTFKLLSNGILEIPAGNVGIGASPTSITNHKVLELKNTASNGRATLALTANNSEYSNLYMGDSDVIDRGGIQYYHGTDVMDFYVAGSSRLNINSSGNVGIGGTPSQRLEVKNTGSAYTCVVQTGANGVAGEDREFGAFHIKNNHSSASGAKVVIEGFRDGGNTDAGMRLNTTASGSEVVRVTIKGNGHVLPGANNAQDLGSSSLRWANIYSYDLHLSNEGSDGNSVDGTIGDWTIQEGSEDLFLINNKSGKKYKFKIEEV